MNIFLIPYAWTRHFAVAVFCAGAGLLAWWLTLLVFLLVGPRWEPLWDGVILLSVLSAAVAGASVLAENLLRRRAFRWLALSTLGATVLSGLLALLFSWLWFVVLSPKLFAPLVGFLIENLKLFTGGMGGEMSLADLRELVEANFVDAEEPSLFSLRYRLGAFVMAGVATSIGPIVARKGEDTLVHLGSGVLVGLTCGLAWYAAGALVRTDLYGAGAVLGFSWGLIFGLFSWAVPDSLYAGWIRVLSASRFARRIPIDALDGKPKERFVGHYPRGLDLFLPAEQGVQELHVSVAVDSKQNYFLRGLTLAPVLVTRFLEKVDLRYDPRRSAPLETRLSSGDRVVLGQGQARAELEFVMLPKEEK